MPWYVPWYVPWHVTWHVTWHVFDVIEITALPGWKTALDEKGVCRAIKAPNRVMLCNLYYMSVVTRFDHGVAMSGMARLSRTLMTISREKADCSTMATALVVVLCRIPIAPTLRPCRKDSCLVSGAVLVTCFF